MIQILQRSFYKIAKENLKIYDIKDMNLKGYTTTEKMMKRQQNAVPPRDFRNRAHDLYKEVQDSQADESEEIITMDIIEGVELRKKQYEQSRNHVENREETGRDSEDEDI